MLSAGYKLKPTVCYIIIHEQPNINSRHIAVLYRVFEFEYVDEALDFYKVKCKFYGEDIIGWAEKKYFVV